jgi:hypothetical protein
MKKYLVALLTAAILLFCSCVHYAIQQGKSGIFDTVYTEGNLLENKGGQGTVWFDLIKYTAQGENFYGVNLTYQYGGSDFRLRKDKAVFIYLNNSPAYYLRFKKRPKHDVQVSQSGGGGHWMSTGMGIGGGMTYIPGAPAVTSVMTTDSAECYLTTRQLYDLLRARSIDVILLADTNDNGTPKTQAARFTDKNFENIKRFYNEQVKNQGGKQN